MDFWDPELYWPAIITLGLAVLYIYATWSYGYWRTRDVPYVTPVPLFGNAMQGLLMVKTMGEVYMDIYKKLDGYSYGGFFKMSKPFLMIRDPELVKTVLVKEFSSFQDNDIPAPTETENIFACHPFALRGQSWKMVRSQLTPSFAPSRIKSLFPLMKEVCQDLVAVLEQNGKTGEVDAKDLCRRFMLDVVTSGLYGIRSSSLKDPTCQFRIMGQKLLGLTDFWTNMKIMIISLFPKASEILKLQFFTKELQIFFRRVIREAIDYRRKNNDVRNDFLQVMLSLQERLSSGNETDPALAKIRISDDDIADQALAFFPDGFETSSLTLSFALYELALNPDIQEKLRTEVKDVVKKYDGEITFESIQEMHLLGMVLSETMRMYPPGMYIRRLCTKPYELQTPSGGTYKVEVGTTVVVPLYALHYDPKYFPNPKRFDPERFREDKHINKYTYFPFGEGPRSCLGFRFALTQLKVGLATILLNFDLRATHRTPVPIVLDPAYFMLTHKGPIWLQFVKRTVL